MSPTQMDLPLFQGIQDTRTDTLQIPTFRLKVKLFFCDQEMFYGQIKNSLLELFLTPGVPPCRPPFLLSSSSSEEFG